MVDQCERFIRDDFFELILGGTSARDVCRSCLWRNVFDPVPTQCVIVDLEFPCRTLDRGASGQKPLNPRALAVITTLTASRQRTSLPPHSLPRRLNLVGHGALCQQHSPTSVAIYSAKLRRDIGGKAAQCIELVHVLKSFKFLEEARPNSSILSATPVAGDCV